MRCFSSCGSRERENARKKNKNNKKPQLCSKSLSLSGVGTTQCWHKEDPLSFCLGSCLIFWSAGGKSITATEPLLCRGMRAPLRLLRAPIRTGVFKMLLSIPSSPLFFYDSFLPARGRRFIKQKQQIVVSLQSPSIPQNEKQIVFHLPFPK